MCSYKITIEDMNCNHCVQKIRQAFQDADDTSAMTANLSKKEVMLDTDLTVEEICEVITNAGYTFTEIEMQ